MSKRYTDGNIKRDWGYMPDIARQNGLTLRYHNKKGEYPRTFELVIARTPLGTDCILKDLYVPDIENKGISNGLTIKQTIIDNAIRSKNNNSRYLVRRYLLLLFSLLYYRSLLISLG